MNRILVINPGSTSTKLAVYEDERLVNEKNLSYSTELLSTFQTYDDQYEMRRQSILDYLTELGLSPSDLTAIAARGGGFGPMRSGAYEIDEAVAKACRTKVVHVSYLATEIAYEFVKEYGIRAFVYDCQTAVTLPDHAKLSGVPQLERRAGGHVLNSRAAAMRAARDLGCKYEENTFIVAHLGGGCSTSLHENGQLVDVIGGDEGTFTPERSGGLPSRGLVNLCFSGKCSEKEIRKFFSGQGGFVAYLGTNDAREVGRRMAEGDEYAALVCRAMAYQITKAIGSLYAVKPDKVRAVVLTGGLAHFKELMDMIVKNVSCFAPVYVYPGAFEMEALAQGVLRVLRGEEAVNRLEE